MHPASPEMNALPRWLLLALFALLIVAPSEFALAALCSNELLDSGSYGCIAAGNTGKAVEASAAHAHCWRRP